MFLCSHQSTLCERADTGELFQFDILVCQFIAADAEPLEVALNMTSSTKSGIQTGNDGGSFIPSSKRPDGSTRKEIRVRPGYRPPEDVETYKNRSAEAWKNRGSGGIPGADPGPTPAENDAKSKNAKRREAARRKADAEPNDQELSTAMEDTSLKAEDRIKQDWRNPEKLATNAEEGADVEADRQKKIRNGLKKLKAVRELKAKKVSGEKLSPDQLMKMSKEDELLHDLKKQGYDGPDLDIELTSEPSKMKHQGPTTETRREVSPILLSCAEVPRA